MMFEQRVLKAMLDDFWVLDGDRETMKADVLDMARFEILTMQEAEEMIVIWGLEDA